MNTGLGRGWGNVQQNAGWTVLGTKFLASGGVAENFFKNCGVRIGLGIRYAGTGAIGEYL